MNPVTLAPVDLVLRVASATEGACEVGANAGPYVERVLKRTGNAKGDPWCAAYVTDVGLAALGTAWPVKKSASVQAICEWAAAKGCRLVATKAAAQPGDLFALWFPKLGRWAHIGFVTSVNPDGSIQTIEGNTNADGSREGWLVARKRRTLTSKDRLVRWTEATG